MKMMVCYKEFSVVAYPDEEGGLKKQTATVRAEDIYQAYDIAWQMFPEYHEIGVWED